VSGPGPIAPPTFGFATNQPLATPRSPGMPPRRSPPGRIGATCLPHRRSGSASDHHSQRPCGGGLPGSVAEKAIHRNSWRTRRRHAQYAGRPPRASHGVGVQTCDRHEMPPLVCELRRRASPVGALRASGHRDPKSFTRSGSDLAK
jgi:hypothetical protein